MLLLKQDRLSLLEKQLDQVDSEETALIRLGSCRNDDNKRRIKILSQVDSALLDYGISIARINANGSPLNVFLDALVERTFRSLSLEPAKSRDMQSLQNWIDGTGCLARAETAYNAHHEDLVNLTPSHDQSITYLDSFLGDALVRLYRRLSKVKETQLDLTDKLT